MIKLIVAFRNFAKVPNKNDVQHSAKLSSARGERTSPEGLDWYSLFLIVILVESWGTLEPAVVIQNDRNPPAFPPGAAVFVSITGCPARTVRVSNASGGKKIVSITSISVVESTQPPIQRVPGIRLQLKCDGTRWRTGGEVKGKLVNGVGSQYSSHYLGTWCIQHYYRRCAQLGCQ